MRSLICQAADCMYNTRHKCDANVIQVNNTSRETFCDTFADKSSFVAELKNNNTFKDAADTEFGSESVPDSPRISCTVSKCAYNKSFRCKADSVEIDEPHDVTICNCRTYRPK